MTDYHYLVIGAGTAGSVLAARLSDNPSKRVLLLEAGPGDGPEAMADPAGWFSLLGTAVDWADTTVAQEKLDGAVLTWPRGKVLGGSSGINGMIHLRGHQSSYDQWEALGADGWNYRTLLPFLKRAESAPGRDSRVRGCSGPMWISPHDEVDPLAEAWLHAALEVGHPMSTDGNGEVTEGVSWTDNNVVDGRRQSAADAYLRPILNRPNLSVVTRAHVGRLVFDGNRCCGAQYSVDGVDHLVEVSDEVVLTAGAIGSAQLLMSSGIGPAEHLNDIGIDVLLDAPEVGQNLRDHPICWISYTAADPSPPTNGPAYIMTTGVPHVLLRSSPSRNPDVQIGFAPMVLGPRMTFTPEPGYSLTFSLMSPGSRGTVRLSGSGPHDPPLIDPAYFTEPDDLDLMVDAMRRTYQIADAEALSPWRGPAAGPEIDVADDDACRAYIRATMGPYFHPVGTCRMGADRLAVVDPRLRVRGVDGLRVADASVMPTIVSANTNATVLGIAERAATFIGR